MASKIDDYKLKKNLQEKMIPYLDPEIDGKYLNFTFKFSNNPTIVLSWDNKIIQQPRVVLCEYIAKNLCKAIENNKDMLMKEAIAEAKKDVKESLCACKEEATEILNFIKQQSGNYMGK